LSRASIESTHHEFSRQAFLQQGFVQFGGHFLSMQHGALPSFAQAPVHAFLSLQHAFLQSAGHAFLSLQQAFLQSAGHAALSLQHGFLQSGEQALPVVLHVPQHLPVVWLQPRPAVSPIARTNPKHTRINAFIEYSLCITAPMPTAPNRFAIEPEVAPRECRDACYSLKYLPT